MQADREDFDVDGLAGRTDRYPCNPLQFLLGTLDFKGQIDTTPNQRLPIIVTVDFGWNDGVNPHVHVEPIDLRWLNQKITFKRTCWLSH